MTFYPYPDELEPSNPNDRTGRNDRLVRRLSAPLQLRVHLRLGTNPQSRPSPADVINVSVAGASLRITRSLPVNAGATVTIGDGRSTATCRVVYAQAHGRNGQVLGLEYTAQSDQFRLDAGQVIAALRRDRGQVIRAWHHAN